MFLPGRLPGPLSEILPDSLPESLLGTIPESYPSMLPNTSPESLPEPYLSMLPRISPERLPELYPDTHLIRLLRPYPIAYPAELPYPDLFLTRL
jgi:hypothetical protein